MYIFTLQIAEFPILLSTTFISDVQRYCLHLYQVYNLFKEELVAQCKSLSQMKNVTVGS